MARYEVLTIFSYKMHPCLNVQDEEMMKRFLEDKQAERGSLLAADARLSEAERQQEGKFLLEELRRKKMLQQTRLA